MTPFDPLLDRATRRLSADPELRLEVAHELRSHLQQSAAEYVAAGLAEQEAIEKAAEAFGNPDELADKLFAANRSRMRLRTIVRLATGMTVGPAAAVVAVSVGWGAVTSALAVLAIVAMLGAWRQPAHPAALAALQRVWNQSLAGLSPADRLVIGEAPSPDDSSVQLNNARAMVERSPNNQVFFANYANLSLLALHHDRLRERPDQVRSALAILDRGAQLEPQNAYYPLQKAGLLMAMASVDRTDVDDDKLPGFSRVDSRGRWRQFAIRPVRVTDPVMFERGLAALHEAAGKPYLSTYIIELERQRLDLLPSPTRLSDEVQRLALQQITEAPLLSIGWYREAISRSASRAVDLPETQQARASQLTGDQAAVARLAVRGAGYRQELIVAWALRQITLTTRAIIAEKTGAPDEFRLARDQAIHEARLMEDMFTPTAEDSDAGHSPRSFVGSELLGWTNLAQDRVVQSSGRRAEYSVADQAAASAIAAMLLLALARWALGAIPGRRKRVGIDIGWGRTVRIVLLGTVLPVVLYGVYAYATPLGSRGYGIQEMGHRIIVEYSALAATICVSTRMLADRAIRERSSDLGLPPDTGPRRPGRVEVAIGLMLVFGVVMYLCAWRPAASSLPILFDSIESGRASFWLLSVGLTLYALWWLVPRGQRWKPISRTMLPPTGVRRVLARRVPESPVYITLGSTTATSLGLILTGVAARYLRQEPILLSVAVACGIGMMLVYFARFAPRLWAAWSGPSAVDGPRVSNQAPLVFAFSALLLLLVGVPFLQWQERKSVAQSAAQLQGWLKLDQGPWRSLQDKLAQ